MGMLISHMNSYEFCVVPGYLKSRTHSFLRDVSIERRNMVEQGQLDVNDTVDQLISNSDIDKNTGNIEEIETNYSSRYRINDSRWK